jgi:hypothetical protein
MERMVGTVGGESFRCFTAEDAEGRRGKKAEMLQTTKQFPPGSQVDVGGLAMVIDFRVLCVLCGNAVHFSRMGAERRNSPYS